MPEQLATLDEVAAFLRVPPKTLYAWRYKGEGPRGLRVGRHVRYRWSDVEAWLASRADGHPARSRIRAVSTRESA